VRTDADEARRRSGTENAKQANGNKKVCKAEDHEDKDTAYSSEDRDCAWQRKAGREQLVKGDVRVPGMRTEVRSRRRAWRTSARSRNCRLVEPGRGPHAVP
jgi:hypothetical protein